MKKTTIIAALLALLPLSSITASSPFPSPSLSGRAGESLRAGESQSLAGARWWWLGSAVTEAGLTWQMEQMASHGIGALEITPLYGVKGNDKNNIPFLSDRWMQVLRHTISEGHRLGIQIDMNLGTGWPFGGPTTPISEAACKLVVVDTIIDTKTARKMMKDPTAVSIPAPEKEQKFATLILKRAYPTADKKQTRLIELFQSRTRQKVKRAAPGGEGFVIDHYDSLAVAHYLQKFDAAFEGLRNKEEGLKNKEGQASAPSPSLTGRAGESLLPATFFNDSYEVYGADWTPSMLREFKARRGYALEDKVQEFVDGDPQVVSDYRETLADLLLHNFTEQWVRWSHSHGVQVRNQAHGSPANLIDLYAAVDIPEIEGFGLSDFGIKGLRQDPGFTRKNFSDLSMLKYASSGAHITGKRLTSSETFTWLTEHFRTSLSQMKPDLDLMFCSGVNRMFFHGACYSPKDDPWPGWRFYASVDMSPTNSIWRDAPALTSYISYCQQRLQAGKPDNDFLVMVPIRNMWRNNTKSRYMMFDIHKMAEKAPEFISSILKIDSLGYDCDYISERYLLTTTFTDGKLQTAAGTRYAALILPEGCIVSDAVRQHISQLRQQGAVIIEGIDSNAMARVAKPEDIRTRLGLKMIRRRDIDIKHGCDIGTCGQCDDTEPNYVYFVSNLTPNDVNEDVKLAATGATAHLSLRSGESCFIETSGLSVMTEYMSEHLGDSATEILDLSANPWTLRFTESQPQVDGTFQLPQLQTWENGLPGADSAANDSIRELMGTGIYETTFSLPDADADAAYRLDLGDLRESARVFINGKEIGTAWCVPFTLDFYGDVLNTGKTATSGKGSAAASRKGCTAKGKNSTAKSKKAAPVNTLRIEVTNLPANRIAAYDRRQIPWRKFNEINVVDINYKKTTYADWKPVPSGLNSTVKLYKVD